MEKYPYLADLDLKQHWREWQQVALPIFVIVAAALLVAFLVLQNRGKIDAFASTSETPARIDLLLAAGPEPAGAPPFDPAFLVASPLEMARAPVAHRFELPERASINEAGDARRVFAAADGLVLFAGTAHGLDGSETEETVPEALAHRLLVLLHRLPGGGFVLSRYEGLAAISVPVGRQVRRGDAVGTLADDRASRVDGAATPPITDAAPLPREAGGWHFEIRRGTAFGVSTPQDGREAANLTTDGFLREFGSDPEAPRVPPVRGEALESGILRLERLKSL